MMTTEQRLQMMLGAKDFTIAMLTTELEKAQAKLAAFEAVEKPADKTDELGA